MSVANGGNVVKMDDLVKRLREVESNHSGWGYAEIAADRIEQLVATCEELEAKLDDKEAECRYLRGQVGLLTAKLERAVFLTDADIARIDEICENPPPITEHMQASLDRILTQTGEK